MPLLVGDDVDTHQNSEILAAQGSTSSATPPPPTRRRRSRIRCHGRTARPVDRGVLGHRRRPGRHLRPGDHQPRAPVQVWGHTDVDTFQFGDPSGDRRLDLGGPGYVFIGSKTRARSAAVTRTT